MKIAFYFAHPSQYFVLRHVVRKLVEEGYECSVYIKSKDILEKLLTLEKVPHKNLLKNRKRKGFVNLAISVLKKNYYFLSEIKRNKPDLIVSAASDISQVAFLRGIPSIILNDDDASVIRKSALFGWPFSSVILAPESCNMGFWKRKTIFYKGYQKLGYLHPSIFQPNPDIIKKYNLADSSFFLIRAVSLTAHHDNNIRGLDNSMVSQLIEKLSKHGKVLITSERELPANLEPYKLQIDPLDIHHIIYFAKLFIGDSQSMAHEAALLGTPSIRFNDLVGRIGVLEELEHKYFLTYGISPDNRAALINKAEEFAQMSAKDYAAFKLKAKKMLSEMIDLSSFLLWFIKNYPKSRFLMEENPNYQFRFIKSLLE